MSEFDGKVLLPATNFWPRMIMVEWNVVAAAAVAQVAAKTTFFERRIHMYSLNDTGKQLTKLLGC